MICNKYAIRALQTLLTRDTITTVTEPNHKKRKIKVMYQNKKTVGIVPTLTQPFGAGDNRYADFYKFSDTYCVRAVEAGLLPIGILPVENRIRTDVLDLCDAFILQGGYLPQPYHIEVIDHAIRNGKKVLGICLGCQSIQVYFSTKSEAEKRGWSGSLSELFIRLTEEKYPFLGRVEGHNPLNYLPRGDKSASKHPVYLTEGSLIAKLYGRTEVLGASYHVFQIEHPAPGITVTGKAADGVTEAIEAGDKILGTQFHPDVDDMLPEVFEWLAK